MLNYEKRKVKTDWICCKCERLKHWKIEAYILYGKYYCAECYEKIFGKSIDKWLNLWYNYIVIKRRKKNRYEKFNRQKGKRNNRFKK